MNQADDNPTRQRELPVNNSLGLHARAAARIAETVQGFNCRVTLHKGESQAEADSVLSILTLDAPLGTTITAQAQGPEAEKALDALSRLFADGFGENQ